MDRLDGKVAIVTGATSGIGLAVASGLLRLGATVKLVGRDPDRLAQARRTLGGQAGSQLRSYLADLSSLTEIRHLAGEILADTPRLDLLVLNAGLIFQHHETSPEGIEKTFALNHLAPFFLTALLRERLIASAPARIIVTASGAHRFARPADLEQAPHPRRFRSIRAYGVSKLANILFAREAARRFAGTGVTAYSFHPGVVATRFASGVGLAGAMLKLAAPFLRSAEHGAETALYLASAPETKIRNGGYFMDCRPARMARLARNDRAAHTLWAQSAVLCGLSSE